MVLFNFRLGVHQKAPCVPGPVLSTLPVWKEKVGPQATDEETGESSNQLGRVLLASCLQIQEVTVSPLCRCSTQAPPVSEALKASDTGCSHLQLILGGLRAASFVVMEPGTISGRERAQGRTCTS